MKKATSDAPRKQQTTRRCHWVPQAYLRAWAVAPGDTARTWRFSKVEGGPELKRIDKVAVKHHLYVPRDASGNRDDALEKKLSELERFYRDPVWQALQTSMVDLGWEPLRKMVSLLAATMFLRTPEQLQRHKEIHASIVEAMNKGVLEVEDSTDWENFRDADEDGIKRTWMSEIERAGYYASLMKDMRWSILISDRPDFITSDNPITFIHPSLRFQGVLNKDTSVMFPLSPTRILMMDNCYQKPHNQYYPLKHHAAVSNLLLWRGATEYMFSRRHPDEVCRELELDARAGGFI